jgi:hypothetical protein
MIKYSRKLIKVITYLNLVNFPAVDNPYAPSPFKNKINP